MTGIIICARLASKRLPGKILKKIAGKTCLEILLEHLGNDYPIIVAIPDSDEDKAIAEEAIRINRNIQIYVGQNESPTHRMYEAAKKFNIDTVVRVTADDILIDMQLLKKQIRFYDIGKLEYCFMSRCPDGIAAEVIDFGILEDIAKKNPQPIEFGSYFFKKYKNHVFYPQSEYQHEYRLTIDYPEDLELIRIIYNLLPDPSTLDIINLLKRNGTLQSINQLPKYTVYTCAYNAEKYINETMQSVINQTENDIEYIVLDDASTDDTLKRIAEFSNNHNIKILRNETNKDLGYSSNRCLERARGKYIMRVDADDVLMPDALNRMIAPFKNREADIVFSDYELIDENGNKIGDGKDELPACCLMKTRYANEIKYRENVQFREWELFLEIYKSTYKSKRIGEKLWQYRKHTNQKTASANY